MASSVCMHRPEWFCRRPTIIRFKQAEIPLLGSIIAIDL